MVQSLPGEASKQFAFFIGKTWSLISNTGGPVPDLMLEFVARENIIRFERHLSATSDEKERRTLLELIRDEKRKLQEART